MWAELTVMLGRRRSCSTSNSSIINDNHCSYKSFHHLQIISCIALLYCPTRSVPLGRRLREMRGKQSVPGKHRGLPGPVLRQPGGVPSPGIRPDQWPDLHRGEQWSYRYCLPAGEVSAKETQHFVTSTNGYY